MTIYLGIDPGRTTGMCWCSQRGKQFVIHDFANIPWNDFMGWTNSWKDKAFGLMIGSGEREGLNERVVVVCEDFILRKAANWTPTPVTKQIGVCYKTAYDLGWHFSLQQPMIKPAGYKLGKIPLPETHWKDALAHVVFAIHHGLDPEQKIIW
jgi:hypothetical protein